ncbi:MAG: DUF935 family protein [bacterium]
MQDKLDSLTALMEDGWKEIMAPLIDPIMKMAAAAHSAEEFKEMLTSAFSDMDPSVLQGVLTRGMFIAEMLGLMEDANG